MKNTVKTKFLAAFTVIAMLLTSFPFAVYGSGETSSYAPPNAEQIKQAIGNNGQLIYYNDFNSADAHSFNTGAVTNGISKGLADRGNNSSFVTADPLRSGNALCLAGGTYTGSDGVHNKSNVNLYVIDNATPVPENSGRSFVWSADIMLGDNVADGNLVNFMCSLVKDNPSTSKKHYAIQVAPVRISANGDLYCGNSLICSLSKDDYTNVAVHVNVAKNTYDLYINGVREVFSNPFLTDAQNTEVKSYEGFENGFSISQVTFYRDGLAENCPQYYGRLYYFDNVSLYLTDTFPSYFEEARPTLQLAGGFSSTLSANYFNTLQTTYKTDAKYWVPMTLTQIDDRNSTVGDDGTVLLKGNGLDSQWCMQYANDVKTGIFEKNLAGTDAAMNFDLLIDSSSPSGCGILSAWMPYSSSATSFWQYHILTFNYDSTSGECGLYLAGPESWKAGTRKLCDLTPDKYENIKILFDLGYDSDTYYVYVNGSYVGCSQVISNKTSYGSLDALYTTQEQWANGNALNCGVIFNGFRFRSQDNSLTYSVKNTALYHYDSQGDGNIFNEKSETNIRTLINYYDFEAEQIGSEAPTNTSYYNPSYLVPNAPKANTKDVSELPSIIVDNGSGGKAMRFQGTSGERFFEISSKTLPATANSGKSFVISADFKWNENASAGYLFGATARHAGLDGYSDVNAQCIFIDKDGRLYYSQKDGGVLINEWSTANQKTYSYGNPDYCFGQLSANEFTNIAISVNLTKNVYSVYVNGKKATPEIPFMPSSVKELFNGSTAYPDGFGFGYARIYLQSLIIDNVAVYTGATPVSLSNGYDYDDDGYICYFENGIKSNKSFSPDGLMQVENGYCKINGSFVRSLSDYYFYLNGCLIPKNSHCKGFYKANALTGQDGGELYYYNENGTRIILKTAYKTANGVYSFNNYGVAAPVSGFVKIDSKTLYCENGIAKTGLFTVGGKTYFADGEGYLADGVTQTENGYYFFNKTTLVGTKMTVQSNSVIANDETGIAYTDIAAAVNAANSGDTLIIISNVSTASAITIPCGDKTVTVDINGKTVACGGFAVFGNGIITDNACEKGIIKADKSNIILSANESVYLPLYDTARGGISFYTVLWDSDAQNDGASLNLSVRPVLDSYADKTKTLFSSGATVTVYLNAVKNDKTQINKTLYFGAEAVKKAYQNDKPLTLKINCIGDYESVKVSYEVTAPLGKTPIMDTYSFTPKYKNENVITATCASVSKVDIIDFSKVTGITRVTDSVKGVCYSASSSYTQKYVGLPTPADFQTYRDYHTFNFSVYSAKKTDAQIQISLVNSKAGSKFNQAITIPLNFVGWRDISIKIDALSVEYPLPTLSGIRIVQILGTAGAQYKISKVSLQRENLVFDTSKVDVNDTSIYDEILQRYKDYTVAPDGSENHPNFTKRVTISNNNCKPVWDSFKATYTGASMTNGLFGIDCRMPSNDPTPENGYDDWYVNGDLAKLTTLYSKIRLMAHAYTFKGTNYYKNPELLADIKAALEYGYNNYYGSYILEHGTIANWYEWRIGVPQELCATLAYIKDELTQAEINKYLAPFDMLMPFPVGAASNLLNMSYACILAGALEKDYERIATALYFTSDIYKYVTIDDMGLGTDGGFFADGSFVQHNVTPYHGSYGMGLIQTIPVVTYIVTDTAFAIPDDKLEIQAWWITDSFAHIMYGDKLMSTTSGRAVGGTSEQGMYNGVLKAMIQMLPYVPDSIAREFRQYVRTQMFIYGSSISSSLPIVYYDYAEQLYADDSVQIITDGFYSKVMGNMCRVVQHGKSYGVAIALSSTRIAKYESINGSNMTGWYHGDGMIYLYTNTASYDAGFYFYINPYLMPGTTVNSAKRVRTTIHPAIPNKYDFAGGTVLGLYSATGFMLGYDQNNLRNTFSSTSDAKIEARKSYFTFDNEVVCIGSGITDASGTTVRTVVENRIWGESDSFYINGNKITDIHTKDIDYNNVSSSNFYNDANSLLVSDYRTAVNGVRSMYFTGMGGYVFTDMAYGNTVKYAKTNVTGHETLGTFSSSAHVKYHGTTGQVVTYSFLEIVLEHGKGDSSLNGSYEYIYLPDATPEQTLAYSSNPDVAILSKTNSVHAAMERKIGVLGAVFFNGATLSVNEVSTPVTKITTSAGACVMLSTDKNGQTSISVSDPTQTLDSLTVQIDITGLNRVISADSGVNAKINGNTLTLNVNVSGACSSSFNVTVK